MPMKIFKTKIKTHLFLIFCHNVNRAANLFASAGYLL
jgi:hypothetical protein